MNIQPIQPNKRLSATLTAEQWNAVLAAVNELPHRIARQIYDTLLEQLRPTHLSSPPTDGPPVGDDVAPRGNEVGLGRHHRDEPPTPHQEAAQ